MKPFLYSIAEAYIRHESDSIGEMCFVFPNKRSATFFNHYLSAIVRKNATADSSPVIHPRTTSIVEFNESFAEGFASADRLEMVFILYDVYRRVIRQRSGSKTMPEVDFNKFVYWADTLIQDFDDVDDAMASPDEIFRNVSTLKEISANYLTQEQADVIKEYWKDFDLDPQVREFWNHMAYEHRKSDDDTDNTDGKCSAAAGFLRLWQVMGDVYREFRAELKKRGLHTPGMNARRTAGFLQTSSPQELPSRRYVFVGFNNLSVAEHTIFKTLAAMTDDSGQPMADFYWDLGSPVFKDSSLPGIGRVRRYADEFPSRYSCVGEITSFPKITVVGIPSRVGQCKAVAQVLASTYPGKPNPVRLRRTAIVMPEETLLTPLVNSLPANIAPLNITMGYKLKNTSVAGLLRNIVSLQMRAYKSRATMTFFIDDVMRILTHPLVRAVDRTAVSLMLTEIRQQRLFNVPEQFFRKKEYSQFVPIFTMVADKQSCRDVFGYLRNLLRWLDNALVTSWWSKDDSHASGGHDNDDTDSDDISNEESGMAQVSSDASVSHSLALQQTFIRRYASAVVRLQALRDTFLEGRDGKPKVFMEDATVFNLVEKIVKGEMLNFEGVPLRGLQVMGVLEARALDFETIIIPSMNERIFPRAKFGATFIPMALRRAYRLSTSEDQEGAFAYFFYRMISRADNVHLLYDARTSGLRSSQPSRFIHQLTHILNPGKMRQMVLPYRLNSIAVPAVSVSKTPEIMEKINRYRDSENPRYLSATAIERYMACPISFYLERIAGFRQSEEMNDWLDEGTYGTIVHQVFEKLYNKEIAQRGRDGKVTITATQLDAMARNRVDIDREITRAVNEHYTRIGKDNDTPLAGDSLIFARIIQMLVKATFSKERDNTPFTYHFGEWDRKMQLHIEGSAGKSLRINFTCKIDRIDQIDSDGLFPRMRIVDYKTGSDMTSAKDVQEVFTNYRVKAFLQLMLYCQAYSQHTGYKGPIQPLIYPIRSIMIKKLEPLQWSAPSDTGTVEHLDSKQPSGRAKKWKLLDYRDYKTEFNDILIERLEKLFDPAQPFTCPDDNNACKYCKFLQICRREIPRI